MILVCGEVLLDVVREPDDPERAPGDRPHARHPARFVGHPGGGPANTAVALSRLGSHAGLCARISRGALGGVLHDHLVENGVDLTYALEADEPASVAFVDVDPDGGAVYSFYINGTADWQWTIDELPDELPDTVTAFHTGSIASVTEPGRHAIAHVLERERGRRMLSFDPNIRPALLAGGAAARAWTERLVASVDLVRASDEDLAYLYPGESIDAVAERWRSLGPSTVVVTLGADGAVGYLAGERVQRPARPVDVVDTVGAGDSYSAALLHWLEREELTALVRAGCLPPAALGAALDFAAAVAALTCSRAGASPPSADEVGRLLAEGEIEK